VIDAHAHVWDLDRRDQPWIPVGSPIRRTYSLSDLERAVSASPVERVILVQVINKAEETAEFLTYADTCDLIAGVVGWVDLCDAGLEDVLHELSATGCLAGIRHQALAELDPEAWLASSVVSRGLDVLERFGLPFDLIVRPQYLRLAAITARAHPSLCLVLDHLGKPPVASGSLDPWAAAVRQLALEPNVCCKLSGVHTVARPECPYRDLEPYLDVALTAFGSDRLIFGSDWPVSTQAASYSEVLDVAKAACSRLPASEQAAVFAGNAERVYRLRPRASHAS
jgi:L-fuconolactonase